jgi:hypothetical protein
MKIKNEIKSIVDQLNEWVEPKYCKCSYMPLVQLVQSAISWAIWEQFRLVAQKDEDAINELIELFRLDKN